MGTGYGAVTQNILLEAAYLGLGGVWLGVAPMKDRMDLISELYGLRANLDRFVLFRLDIRRKDRSINTSTDLTRIGFTMKYISEMNKL